MNRIGYLSSTGYFYNCAAYGHLELVRKICLRIYSKEFSNAVQAESYLLDNGCVMFQEDTVEFKFRHSNGKRLLSPKQKYFLMDEIDLCTNEVKLSSINAMLTMNHVLSNTNTEDIT